MDPTTQPGPSSKLRDSTRRPLPERSSSEAAPRLVAAAGAGPVTLMNSSTCPKVE